MTRMLSDANPSSRAPTAASPAARECAIAGVVSGAQVSSITHASVSGMAFVMLSGSTA